MHIIKKKTNCLCFPPNFSVSLFFWVPMRIISLLPFNWARPDDVRWPMQWEERRITPGQQYWAAGLHCSMLSLLLPWWLWTLLLIGRGPGIETAWGAVATIEGQLLPYMNGTGAFVPLSTASLKRPSPDSDNSSSLLLFPPRDDNRSLKSQPWSAFSWALATSL